MSSRDIRARLDRLAKALSEQKPHEPVCRFHGTACRLGANWPLRYEPGPLDDLLDMRAAGRFRRGLEPEPHPRELWAVDRHERVPAEELAREEREAEELLVSVRARNDQILAELLAERTFETNPLEEL